MKATPIIICAALGGLAYYVYSHPNDFPFVSMFTSSPAWKKEDEMFKKKEAEFIDSPEIYQKLEHARLLNIPDANNIPNLNWQRGVYRGPG